MPSFQTQAAQLITASPAQEFRAHQHCSLSTAHITVEGAVKEPPTPAAARQTDLQLLEML